MHAFILLLGVVPSLNALCAIQGCDKWYSSVKNNVSVTGACAVMFDENCCKASKTFHIVKKGEEGKLCDIESLAVMPGCTLEVWDKGSGLEDAQKEEKKGFNAGNIRDNKDRYDRNKLTISAQGTPNFVEEINDDFDDMDEDIESYRCKC